MNFFKKQPKVEFYSIDWARTYNYPIEPISTIAIPWAITAKATLISKNKNNLHDFSSTHMCSGIRGIMNTGYVLKAPNDFIISTDGDGVSFTWEQPHASLQPLDYFSPDQFGDYAPLPPQTLRSLIRVITPWRVKLPAGWNLLVLPIQYSEPQPFTSSIGILNPEISRQLSPVLYWHNLNGRELIKAGTPLCQLIPIRSDILPIEVRKPTEQELEFEQITNATLSASYRPVPFTVMKKLSDRFFKAKKRCPFH
jgi:hypothetical protein